MKKSMLKEIIIFFSIIPILPITLIYIIIYLAVKYREKRKNYELNEIKES